jgi:enoyl-CoA hydratase/carnithine racemase
MAETIKYQVDADGVAVFKINTGSGPVNLINPLFTRDLGACLDQVIDDKNVSGIVLTSAKSDFMAGADLNYVMFLMEHNNNIDFLYEKGAELSKVYRRLETCGKPVVVSGVPSSYCRGRSMHSPGPSRGYARAIARRRRYAKIASPGWIADGA